jgi:predicted TIM-barrel fold metal-dependent hydrolase
MTEFVIDADGHIMEDHKDLFAHIKGNFAEMNWHTTWPMFDADGWQRGLSRKGKREDPDAEAWLRFQNENGIDLAVLYPTSALALGMIQLPAWASALAQGYNDWLHHRFTSQSRRLKGVALLPPQDPRAAAAELRRCVKDLGFCAGLLPSVTNNRIPLYGSPIFHELYDTAQGLDVPLTIHGGISQNLGLDRLCSFMEVHVLEHPVGLFLQITNMMFQGIFQEFPRLRVAYLEAGAGWVPFMMDRMEEDYEKFAARLAPHLTSPPSRFFKSGNIFFTMEVEERTAPFLPEWIHPDVIMWASDFPHERERDQFGGDLPHLMARKDLSDEFKRRMLYDNPVRFYRFSEGDIAAAKQAGSTR